MANQKAGRPFRTDEHGNRTDPRSGKVAFYVTEEDAIYLNEISETYNFRSRSEMVTAIMERLIIGGFSPMVFAKLGFQLSRRATDNGVVGRGLYFGLRPLPHLSDEVLTEAEYQTLLRDIEKEKQP